MKNVSHVLPNGNWMLRDSVLSYLYHRMCKVTLAHLIEKMITPVCVNGVEYIPTSDISNIATESMFQSIESNVTTFLVYNQTSH
jgi:hypothetical protein